MNIILLLILTVIGIGLIVLFKCFNWNIFEFFGMGSGRNLEINPNLSNLTFDDYQKLCKASEQELIKLVILKGKDLGYDTSEFKMVDHSIPENVRRTFYYALLTYMMIEKSLKISDEHILPLLKHNIKNPLKDIKLLTKKYGPIAFAKGKKTISISVATNPGDNSINEGEDLVALAYILGHEMSHCCTPEIGHTPLFKENFEVILKHMRGLVVPFNFNHYVELDYAGRYYGKKTRMEIKDMRSKSIKQQLEELTA